MGNEVPVRAKKPPLQWREPPKAMMMSRRLKRPVIGGYNETKMLVTAWLAW